MEKMAGGTWTRRALQEAFDKEWSKSLAKTEPRGRMAILLSDGAPSFFQDPCPLADTYTDAGKNFKYNFYA